MADEHGPVLDRIAAMPGYEPGEQPRGAGLVKLNTNENPYPPSPRAVDAARAALEGGLNLYPDPSSTVLREAASACYGVPVDNVVAGNGSDEVLAMALRACVGQGGRVVYTTPTYSLYATLAATIGARTRELAWPEQLSDEDSGDGVPEGLAEAATDADLCFVCSPNSPSGRAVSPEAIAGLARASRGLVLADEAYIDFGSGSAIELIGEHDNLLVTRSLSKSYSLAGMRLGLGLGQAGLIDALVKTKDSYNVSRVSAVTGQAALEDQKWMRANAERVIDTRERVTAELRARGRRVPASAANFFWLDCGREGGRLVFERLRESGVLVRYFDNEMLGGGVRVSVGTDEQMDRFLEAVGD